MLRRTLVAPFCTESFLTILRGSASSFISLVASRQILRLPDLACAILVSNTLFIHLFSAYVYIRSHVLSYTFHLILQVPNVDRVANRDLQTANAMAKRR